MHCPNCGTETAAQARFCRACGLNLEKIAELVAEQLPAELVGDSDDAGKVRWQRMAERSGAVLLFGGGALFVLIICWAIVSKVIIAKGDYLTGALLLLILALVAGGALLGISNSPGAAGKKPRASSTPDSLAEAKSTDRLLTEPGLEPVPSITERTTELLTIEEKRGGK